MCNLQVSSTNTRDKAGSTQEKRQVKVHIDSVKQTFWAKNHGYFYAEPVAQLVEC